MQSVSSNQSSYILVKSLGLLGVTLLCFARRRYSFYLSPFPLPTPHLLSLIIYGYLPRLFLWNQLQPILSAYVMQKINITFRCTELRIMEQNVGQEGKKALISDQGLLHHGVGGKRTYVICLKHKHYVLFANNPGLYLFS